MDSKKKIRWIGASSHLTIMIFILVNLSNIVLTKTNVKMTKLCLFFFLIINGISLKVFSQHVEEQQTFFSSRLSNPVKIEVIKGVRNEVTFMAENDSWYSYQIELQFSILTNLSPSATSYKSIIHHGSNTLLKLTSIDPNYPYNYSYSFRYTIGDPDKKPETFYPYLIPLAQGKEIHLMVMAKNDAAVQFLKNIFELKNGDTIFCMRKGTVTAVPGDDNRFDRILKGNSIEVLHTDGTVATYLFPKTIKVLVFPGKEVYPLQPLAIMQVDQDVNIRVFKLTNNFLSPFDFKYENDDGTILNGKIVTHSTNDIEKELTKREKKKMHENELY